MNDQQSKASAVTNLDDIELDHLLTLEVTSVESRLKESLSYIMSKLVKMDLAIDRLERYRDSDMEMRKSFTKLESTVRNRELKLDDMLTRQQVYLIAEAKIADVFCCTQGCNIASSVLLENQRKKLQAGILAQCRQIVVQQLKKLSIKGLLQQKDGGESQPSDKEQRMYEQVLRINLTKSSDLFNLTKEQLGSVARRLLIIEDYLKNKNLQNLIGRPIPVQQPLLPRPQDVLKASDSSPLARDNQSIVTSKQDVLRQVQQKSRGQLDQQRVLQQPTQERTLPERQGQIGPQSSKKKKTVKLVSSRQSSNILTEQETQRKVQPVQKTELKQTMFIVNQSQPKEDMLISKNIWRSKKQEQKSAIKSSVRARTSSKSRRQPFMPPQKSIKQVKAEVMRVANDTPLERKHHLDEATLKHFDLKYEYNLLLKELDSRLETKLNREVFLTYVEQNEQRCNRLASASLPAEINQLRKGLMFVDGKVSQVISVLQQPQEDDPLIARRKWACLSCEKVFQKYSARLGAHLHWESVQPRKTSPLKPGTEPRRQRPDQIKVDAV